LGLVTDIAASMYIIENNAIINDFYQNATIILILDININNYLGYMHSITY